MVHESYTETQLDDIFNKRIPAEICRQDRNRYIKFLSKPGMSERLRDLWTTKLMVLMYCLGEL